MLRIYWTLFILTVTHLPRSFKKRSYMTSHYFSVFLTLPSPPCNAKIAKSWYKKINYVILGWTPPLTQKCVVICEQPLNCYSKGVVISFSRRVLKNFQKTALCSFLCFFNDKVLTLLKPYNIEGKLLCSGSLERRTVCLCVNVQTFHATT